MVFRVFSGVFSSVFIGELERGKESLVFWVVFLGFYLNTKEWKIRVGVLDSADSALPFRNESVLELLKEVESLKALHTAEVGACTTSLAKPPPRDPQYHSKTLRSSQTGTLQTGTLRIRGKSLEGPPVMERKGGKRQDPSGKSMRPANSVKNLLLSCELKHSKYPFIKYPFASPPRPR